MKFNSRNYERPGTGQSKRSRNSFAAGSSRDIPETATSTFGGIVMSLPASVKYNYPRRRIKSQITNYSIKHYKLNKDDVNKFTKDIYHKYDHIA